MSTTSEPAMNLLRECRHVKNNGLKCHSPAMRGSPFCYFHARPRTIVARARRMKEKRIQLPPLDSPAAIRAALATVMNAAANGDITPERAGKLLYGIQLVQSGLTPPSA